MKNLLLFYKVRKDGISKYKKENIFNNIIHCQVTIYVSAIRLAKSNIQSLKYAVFQKQFHFSDNSQETI